MPPVGGRRDAQGREVRLPRRIGAIAPCDAPPRAWRQRIAERADGDRVLIGPARAPIARRRLPPIDAQRRRAAKHRKRRRDAQRIGQAQTMQRLAHGAVVAVFGVGDDRGQREPRRAAPPHQRQGEAPFLLKADRRGNPRRRAAAPVAGPALGQVQQRAQRPRPTARPQARRSRRLGNSRLCPAPRSTVAPRRPNAGPTWENSFRRGSECPCARASRPAGAATPPRPPTARA